MTMPLILQIQEAALDSKSSVTDALRKAKIACAKLGLTDFGNWIELELNGYTGKQVGEFPKYRKLYGTPQGYNPVRGWQPIMISGEAQEKLLSLAPIGMTISAIEESLRDAKSNSTFGVPYPNELQQELSNSLNFLKGTAVRIQLAAPQAADIVHAVRNILLDWTIEMEKQGILGENLSFSPQDREKSATIAAQTINNFNIGQVGALVQNAEHSLVQGGVGSTLAMSQDVRDLVQQLEQLLPAAKLPAQIEGNTREALNELKGASNGASPDGGRLRKGLESLQRVLAPAGETLLKLAVDAAVKNILGSG